MMSETGERYAYSELTGTWYRVTEWEWVDKENGKLKAKQKTEVDKSDVPQAWLVRMGAEDEA